MSRMFHPECFTCSQCGTPLGEKDPFTLWSSGQLFWWACVTLFVCSIQSSSYVCSCECCKREECEDVDGVGGATIQHIRIPLIQKKPVKFRWVPLFMIATTWLSCMWLFNVSQFRYPFPVYYVYLGFTKLLNSTQNCLVPHQIAWFRSFLYT